MIKALFANQQEKVVIKSISIGPTLPYQVRIKTVYSYISAGTELTQLQMGSRLNIKKPVTSSQIGYSLAGVVTEIGSEVNHVAIGDRVACIGQGAYHSTEVLVPKNLVVPIPQTVSFEDAAPLAMMCFPFEGVRKATLQFGENVLVIGAGLMGQIAAQLVYRSGCNVFLVDTNPNRLKHTPVGAETVLGNDEGWKHIQQKFAPIGVEAVFMCLGGEATELFDKVKTLMSTSPDGISQGRIIFSGGATITLTLASTSGNLQIFSSAKAGPGYRDPAFEQGRDYPNSYVKWTVKRNMQVLLDAIARKLLVIKPLITHIYPFVDALEAYKKLAQPNTDALGVLLDYNV